jgi:hypothetical protein
MMQHPELDPSPDPNEESLCVKEMVALNIVTEIFTKAAFY